MTVTGMNLTFQAAAEKYFTDLRRIRASGGATRELSSHGPLANLLNAVGASLNPKVFCVGELADQGAGRPDFGLFAAHQTRSGQPRARQAPERGVVEVKAADDDAWLTAASDQVTRYCRHYQLVLVTNTRDFVLVRGGENRLAEKLETFRLAGSADEFQRRLEKPRAFASEAGTGLGEYLRRALAHRSAITEPRDLAALLASYARDGLSRAEEAGDTPPLRAVRSALEDALGVRFEGDRGTRFFHSTLVQTLFYGVFSAWVLWAREGEAKSDRALFPGRYRTERFDWRTAVWHLRAPVLRALFLQLSDPGRLKPLGLVEVLDWSAAALDRVDKPAFFARFNEGEAVPYFYEPFLEAFDPALRKQLGVWYTPQEVVRYMVARVDKALKDELGIADGLAAENVYVLDPCCGTGAYLAEVLRRMADNLKRSGTGPIVTARLREAVAKRVFGFEIMPAPFVVAHLQVGLTMQDLHAPLATNGDERACVYLTNALTGWERKASEPVLFHELQEERDRAEHVKHEAPILVILGNPPYNGFAGMAMDEERELSEAYRSTTMERQPEGQGLNDLYVRFFRMAERRIAENTGRGIVCFISNYSWLDGFSFAGMREHFIKSFDAIRIDCLNGDRYKTGKVGPDGSPDPSVFSTEGDPVGIQVGTAIATLVRKSRHAPSDSIGFRHLWGVSKREELVASAEADPTALYRQFTPIKRLGLPFVPMPISNEWFTWPTLPELFPAVFPGVKTSRDGFLVDIDLDRLKTRISEYFDPAISHEEIARRYPSVMKTTSRFAPRAVRDALLSRGGPVETGFVRFSYRPFDNRWLYWERDSKLLDEKRANYRPHAFEGNLWVEVREREAKEEFSRGTVVRHLADNFGSGLSSFFPLWLHHDGIGCDATERRANLSQMAQQYLDRLGADAGDLFHHVVATLHDRFYRDTNASALRLEWPRIHLPGWPDGDIESAASVLAKSASIGREIVSLLDLDTPVLGVTEGELRPEIIAIASPSTVGGSNMPGDDFTLTAGWGYQSQNDAIMAGKGRAVDRAFTHDERAILRHALPVLGKHTLDIHMNDRVYWKNVPSAIWNYKLGGYQVLKKWLSYREFGVLGRQLTTDEVEHFSAIARRIYLIILTTHYKGSSPSSPLTP